MSFPTRGQIAAKLGKGWTEAYIMKKYLISTSYTHRHTVLQHLANTVRFSRLNPSLIKLIDPSNPTSITN